MSEEELGLPGHVYVSDPVLWEEVEGGMTKLSLRYQIPLAQLTEES